MELQHYDKVVFIEQPEHIYDSVIGRHGFIVDINDDLIDVWVHFDEEERSDTITEVESSCVKFLSHTPKADCEPGDVLIFNYPVKSMGEIDHFGEDSSAICIEVDNEDGLVACIVFDSDDYSSYSVENFYPFEVHSTGMSINPKSIKFKNKSKKRTEEWGEGWD